MDVKFVDTTMRDGSQSLWASWMRTGVMEAIAPRLDVAGFHAIEVPVIAIYFKKRIRDMKEDPWEMLRLMGKLMPKTQKTCMGGIMMNAFERPPQVMVELFFRKIAETGACNRVQLIANTMDQRSRDFPWLVPMLNKLGMEVSFALAYQITPRHTDEYYADLARDLHRFKPKALYLKDQGGLMTVDRARTLLPAIKEAAGDIPVEFHSHCTTGVAPLSYLEAVKLGIDVLHTGVPPLADGSAQPSIVNVARNLEMMGHTPLIDLDPLGPVTELLTSVARSEGFRIGAPMQYDYAQYVHQVPGGVISNLHHQLSTLGLDQHIDQVLIETVEVQRELGYPMMITPYSQFVVTQSAINVATGKRYSVVTDEIIRFAQGEYGEDSGYGAMDQDIRDRILSNSRAGQLKPRANSDMSVQEIRSSIGAAGLSDEDFLMRYIMGGSSEIEAMRAAGPHRTYGRGTPLGDLIGSLSHYPSIKYVSLQRGSASLVLQKQ